MSEMKKQEQRKKGGNNYPNNSRVEYACGCRYSVGRQVRLECVCLKHIQMYVSFRPGSTRDNNIDEYNCNNFR